MVKDTIDTNATDKVQPKTLLKQLIVFRIGDEEFGVPIETIQEIIKISTVTPIPDAPDFIKGLINVRGDIVAAIDVRARFFLPTDNTVDPKHIVIAKHDHSLFGLMVDEVLEVLRIQESDIKSPPDLIPKVHKNFVSGVLTHEGRLIIILDLNEVLSEKELARLAKIADIAHKKKHAPHAKVKDILNSKKQTSDHISNRKKQQ